MIRRAITARHCPRALVATFVLAGAFASVVVAACTVFDGLSVPDPDSGTSPIESGADAGDGAAEANDPCSHVLPPGPPSAGDRQGGLAFVARSLVLGVASGSPAQGRGYDLDGVCSCGPGAPPPSCTTRDAAAAVVCDGEGGLDNAAAGVFDLAATRGADVAGVAASAIARGETSLLVEMTDYAGDDDDRTVQVVLYVSVGPKNNGAAPTFLPNEVWRLDKTRSLDNATQPRPLARALGFVRGRVVVVSFDRVTIPIDAERQIDLRSVALTAQIAADGATLANGVITGRWAQSEALRTFANLRIGTDGGAPVRLCDDKASLEVIRARVCESRDLTSVREGDRSGAACDALSVAVGFEAVKAVIDLDGVATTRTDTCALPTCEP